MWVESFAMTVAGKTRSDNQENFYLNGKYKLNIEEQFLSAGNKSDDKRNTFAVFRGIGGAEYGSVASFIGASILGAFQKKDLNKSIDNYKENANSKICKYIIDSDGIKSGTTAAILQINDNAATAYNVGDGCVLYIHKGQIKKLTGDATDEHLGVFRSEKSVSIDKGVNVTVSEGDRFIVCSSGLAELISDHEISEIIKRQASAKDTIAGIFKATMEKDTKNTFTAVVVKCCAEEQREKVQSKKTLPIGIIAAALLLIGLITAACVMNLNKPSHKKNTDIEKDKPAAIEKTVETENEDITEPETESQPEKEEEKSNDSDVQKDTLKENESEKSLNSNESNGEVPEEKANKPDIIW